MALNNLWGKLGAFSRNVLVPSNVIYKSFDANPLVSDKMSRAISRWYGMYVDMRAFRPGSRARVNAGNSPTSVRAARFVRSRSALPHTRLSLTITVRRGISFNSN